MEEMAHPPEVVARLLKEIGQRLELGGDSPFKFRAYYTAADSLRALTTPLPELVASGKLKTIPGVGDAIAEKIIKLHKTGTHPTLEFLRGDIPISLLEFFDVPGLGAKKIMVLYIELKLKTLDELDAACRDGRVAGCKGMGEKLQEKILKGIDFKRKRGEANLMHDAQRIADAACTILRKTRKDIVETITTGELRRGCEIVKTPGAVVVISEDVEHPSRISDGTTFFLTDKHHQAATLLYSTGSTGHWRALQEIAVEQGLELRETGLFKNDAEVPCMTEADIYAALGLPYIEPELREGGQEFKWARVGNLPKLVQLSDLRGILHSHTTFSDGAETLKTMADAVLARGYQYYGVCDHSQTAVYAGGMKPERVAEQQKLADELNAEYAKKNFRIFKGIESDIREDGSLDYAPDVLKTFELVVASVHSRFALDAEKQTQRVLNAVRNPFTTILGHSTGRLLLRRDGFALDSEAVLKACAENGVVVEINASPHRLDLDWRLHQRALELGCMLSINPDAHEIGEIDLVWCGVKAARKGGVPKERILNCMDLPAITEYFRARKQRAAAKS